MPEIEEKAHEFIEQGEFLFVGSILGVDRVRTRELCKEEIELLLCLVLEIKCFSKKREKKLAQCRAQLRGVS
jgi:hypothetical protein